jgi:hypothetical protein
MRKRLITPTPETVRSRGEGWLDVERAAIVEITSEDKDYPVESAFASGEARGWRAAEPGPQTIRLVFDQPRRLRSISLVFEENEIARTQEFVLRCSSDGRSAAKDIVRQQWNFSPPESIREVEEYQACVMAGYPGSIASTWQRAGRAGRRSGSSCAVFVASSAPLDQFIVQHPDYFFDRSPEQDIFSRIISRFSSTI